MRTVFISKRGLLLWRAVGKDLRDYNAVALTPLTQGWSVSGADIIPSSTPTVGPWTVSGSDLISN